MGVIQNGINQLLQTTAIGIGGAKKISADNAAVKNEAAVKLPAVEQEIASLEEQDKETTARLDATQSGLDVKDGSYDPVTGNISGIAYGFHGEEQGKVQQSYDAKKLTMAQKVLTANLTAMKMQRSQYLKVLGKRGK